jgi:hypothetical protein
MSANADEGVDKDFVVVDTTLFICPRLLNIALLVDNEIQVQSIVKMMLIGET